MTLQGHHEHGLWQGRTCPSWKNLFSSLSSASLAPAPLWPSLQAWLNYTGVDCVFLHLFTRTSHLLCTDTGLDTGWKGDGREQGTQQPRAAGIHNPPGETDKYSSHKRLSHDLMGEIQSGDDSPGGMFREDFLEEGQLSWEGRRGLPEGAWSQDGPFSSTRVRALPPTAAAAAPT